MTGPLFLANDGNGTSQGCTPASFAGMSAGSIAIVDAGGCEFTFKALNAQANGAVAVIVLNNVPGDPVTMEGTTPSVEIPAVMVSQESRIRHKGHAHRRLGHCVCRPVRGESSRLVLLMP